MNVVIRYTGVLWSYKTLATSFAAEIKKDFGVDTLLVKLQIYQAVFDIDVDGVLIFSFERDGKFVAYDDIRAAILRTHPPRPARPWDLWDKDIGRVPDDIARVRLEICNQCDQYLKLTHQCKECGCIMNAKVVLPNAYCPLSKWTTHPRLAPWNERTESDSTHSEIPPSLQPRISIGSSSSMFELLLTLGSAGDRFALADEALKAIRGEIDDIEVAVRTVILEAKHIDIMPPSTFLTQTCKKHL